MKPWLENFHKLSNTSPTTIYVLHVLVLVSIVKANFLLAQASKGNHLVGYQEIS
jgi:hypothetical protein